MYKMIGTQKMNSDKKVLKSTQSKMPEYADEQGDLSPAKTEKSGGKNTKSGFFSEGDVGKMGGKPPFDEDYGKSGGSNVDIDSTFSGKNEYTQTWNKM